MAGRDQLLNDPEDAFRQAFDGRQACLWSALPGIVTEVDLAQMTCSVQPAIQGTVEDENGRKQSVNLPVLIHVPICFQRAGAFILTMPLAVGDEVLVVFSSRCIDAWWQSGGVQRPMESRMHDLSDGFAIPGPTSQAKLVSGISTTGAQLRSVDGSTYIEISADGKVKINATQTNIQGPVNITGNVNITGALAVSGTVTGSDVIAGLIHLLTHMHTGVTTGSGTSGGPV